MIPYSVHLRQNPLNREEPRKAYAMAQVSHTLTSDEFCQHVAQHNTVFSKGVIKGVLNDLATCLREQLLAGNKVILDGLGTFYYTIACRPAETIKDFTADNITAVNLRFTSATALQNLRKDATFGLVSPRQVQRDTLKAIKEGKTNVDLSAKD